MQFDPNSWSVMVIRQLDAKKESNFRDRACTVRSSVAHLFVLCEVAGVAWLELKSREEALEVLRHAKSL